MTLAVRAMKGSEADVIIEYFLRATPEYTEILGVRAADGRIQISRDPYDGARPAQLSSSRYTLGDRAITTQ
jgi:hypothetical protein